MIKSIACGLQNLSFLGFLGSFRKKEPVSLLFIAAFLVALAHAQPEFIFAQSTPAIQPSTSSVIEPFSNISDTQGLVARVQVLENLLNQFVRVSATDKSKVSQLVVDDVALKRLNVTDQSGNDGVPITQFYLKQMKERINALEAEQIRLKPYIAASASNSVAAERNSNPDTRPVDGLSTTIAKERLPALVVICIEMESSSGIFDILHNPGKKTGVVEFFANGAPIALENRSGLLLPTKYQPFATLYVPNTGNDQKIDVTYMSSNCHIAFKQRLICVIPLAK